MRLLLVCIVALIGLAWGALHSGAEFRWESEAAEEWPGLTDCPFTVTGGLLVLATRSPACSWALYLARDGRAALRQLGHGASALHVFHIGSDGAEACWREVAESRLGKGAFGYHPFEGVPRSVGVFDAEGGAQRAVLRGTVGPRTPDEDLRRFLRFAEVWGRIEARAPDAVDFPRIGSRTVFADLVREWLVPEDA